MTLENRLFTVSELGYVGDLEDRSSGRVSKQMRLAEICPLETTINEEFNEIVRDKSGKGKFGLTITGLVAGAVGTAIALPLAYSFDMTSAAIGITLAGLIASPYILMPKLHDFGFDYLEVLNEKMKTKKLTHEGYVFAHQLENQILLPSTVEGVDLIHIKDEFTETPGPFSWYAVKEQDVSAPVIPLSEVGNYVGETVIIPVQITAVGSYNDMKPSARGKFSGTLMGAFPLQMTGTIDGRVFTEDVSFRISDSEGNNIPVYLGYLAPHLKEQLPLQLRNYSPVTRNVSVSDENQLVNFLTHAQNSKRQLLLLGKLDRTGNFNMEALADPGTKEVYALAVYQPR